jgi:hypothetical protein
VDESGGAFWTEDQGRILSLSAALFGNWACVLERETFYYVGGSVTTTLDSTTDLHQLPL